MTLRNFLEVCSDTFVHVIVFVYGASFDARCSCDYLLENCKELLNFPVHSIFVSDGSIFVRLDNL